MESVKVQIRLNAEQKQRLRDIAAVRKIGMSEVVKDLIAEQYFRMKAEGKFD